MTRRSEEQGVHPRGSRQRDAHQPSEELQWFEEGKSGGVGGNNRSSKSQYRLKLGVLERPRRRRTVELRSQYRLL
jgi:hypothetical protein